MNATTDNNHSLDGVFIFDGTRLRSHLFFRYLSTHNAFDPIYHPFVNAAMFGPERLGLHYKHSQMRREEVERSFTSDATFEGDRKAFSQAIQKVKTDGKIPLASEHWFNVVRRPFFETLLRSKDFDFRSYDLGHNPTRLPDSFFSTLTPIILIRHPVQSIASIHNTAVKDTALRPGDEDYDLICINRPLRVLFDYFDDQGKRPIVVDGEDLIEHADEITKALCARLGHGIEADGFSTSWEATPKEVKDKLNPIVLILASTIFNSTGIHAYGEEFKNTRRTTDIEIAMKEWTRAYDPKTAEYMRNLVEENMPHYEYLSKFKLS